MQLVQCLLTKNETDQHMGPINGTDWSNSIGCK